MSRDPVTWQRLREIFGHPEPVRTVTERQFDYFDDQLQALGRTPYEEIDFGDLWYYHHDLAYVELQPELFAYLFPVCLMDWHRSLLANEVCSHGDSEFHYGIIQGNVLDKMLTQAQRVQVEALFRDSMLYRLDQERGFPSDGQQITAYGWMARFNSLGLLSLAVRNLWQTWWATESHGHAVAALQYCSGLMYYEGENPLFDLWCSGRNFGGPFLWENDARVHDRGWSHENVDFIRELRHGGAGYSGDSQCGRKAAG